MTRENVGVDEDPGEYGPIDCIFDYKDVDEWPVIARIARLIAAHSAAFPSGYQLDVWPDHIEMRPLARG